MVFNNYPFDSIWGIDSILDVSIEQIEDRLRILKIPPDYEEDSSWDRTIKFAESILKEKERLKKLEMI